MLSNDSICKSGQHFKFLIPFLFLQHEFSSQDSWMPFRWLIVRTVIVICAAQICSLFKILFTYLFLLLFKYSCLHFPPLTFLKKIIYFQTEEKGGRKRERKTSVCSCLLCIPTGDLACNPGMCPDQELNQQLFGLQAGAQSTEPYQPGEICSLFKGIQGHVLRKSKRQASGCLHSFPDGKWKKCGQVSKCLVYETLKTFKCLVLGGQEAT